MMRHFKVSGTPQQVSKIVQPFIEAGANHVMIYDYGAIVTARNDIDRLAGGSRVSS